MRKLKNSIFKIISVIGALTFLTGNFTACAKGPFDDYLAEYNISSKVFFYFNSACLVNFYYNKTVEGERGKAFLTLNAAERFIADVEQNLSCEKEGGDIYRFNHAAPGETIAVSEMTYEVIEKTQQLYMITDGAFNPAVYPLVDLWGFSARILSGDEVAAHRMPYDRLDPTKELPAEEYITAFTTLTNYSDIVLSKNTDAKEKEYYLTKPETSVTVKGMEYSMQIDLGGYGKGYAADGVREIVARAGFEYGYISIGTSSLTLLKCPQEETLNQISYDWQINLTYPDKEKQANSEWYIKLFGQNQGVSTSGDYERFYDLNGVHYSHLIDGKTGCPITSGTAAVSIVGGSAAENDALTTALSVMTKDRAIEFIHEYIQNKQVVLLSHTSRKNKYQMYTNVPTDKFIFKSEYEKDFVISDMGATYNK